MSQNDSPEISREEAKKAAIIGLFVGIFGVHDYLLRRYVLGVIHTLLIAYSIISAPIIYGIGFACSMNHCKSGLDLNILFNASLYIPQLISFVMAIIECIIIFATLSKYNSWYQIAKQPPIDKNTNL